MAIPECFADGATEAFVEAVAFGRVRGQDVMRDAGIAAGEFEVAHELRIAIDLDRAYREGHKDGVEALLGALVAFGKFGPWS